MSSIPAPPIAAPDCVYDVLASEDELHFVVHSWAHSYRKSHHGLTIQQQSGRYDAWMRQRVARLLERSLVVVAHDAEHPDQFLGWACGEASLSGLVLHYVFVKSWKRDRVFWLGMVGELEQRLQVSGPRRYTHRTYATRRWENHGWSFAPHLVSGREDAVCKPDGTVH